MRINKYVASSTGLSRRGVDQAIAEGRLSVNGQLATAGQQINESDSVTLDNRPITPAVKKVTLILNKPAGYVVSREGQGSKTVYDLLPPEYHSLKPVGRLDKDSSGLLLLTNDGELAHRLTHPSFQKEKVYEIEIDKPLKDEDFRRITQLGVDIRDGRPSQFQLFAKSKKQKAKSEENPNYFLPLTYFWRATLAEGRNRQIRRTFAALGYDVTKLHRTMFGPYGLSELLPGSFQRIDE